MFEPLGFVEELGSFRCISVFYNIGIALVIFKIWEKIVSFADAFCNLNAYKISCMNVLHNVIFKHVQSLNTSENYDPSLISFYGKIYAC